MGRAKGTPKTGGRKRGTPNKVNATLREFIGKIIDDNRERIIEDLQELDPYQRLLFIERLINYVLPKQSSVDIQSQIEAEYKALEQLIDDAPDEFVDRITDKVLKLQEKKQDEQ